MSGNPRCNRGVKWCEEISSNLGVCVYVCVCVSKSGVRADKCPAAAAATSWKHRGALTLRAAKCVSHAAGSGYNLQTSLFFDQWFLMLSSVCGDDASHWSKCVRRKMFHFLEMKNCQNSCASDHFWKDVSEKQMYWINLLLLIMERFKAVSSVYKHFGCKQSCNIISN